MHTYTYTSRRMIYRACVLTFFLNPALCAFFHLLVFAAFSQCENLCLYGLCPQLHGELLFRPCCVILATSFEHPCSKSCFCRMYSFFDDSTCSHRKRTKKSNLFKKSSAVFGSFTSSHRTKSLCGDRAEVSNSMVLPAPLPLNSVLPQHSIRYDGRR